MASYTPTELRNHAFLFAGFNDALDGVYAKMYESARVGGYGCTSDPITPSSIFDQVKTELEGAGYIVSNNQGDPTKLDISWETE